MLSSTGLSRRPVALSVNAAFIFIILTSLSSCRSVASLYRCEIELKFVSIRIHFGNDGIDFTFGKLNLETLVKLD